MKAYRSYFFITLGAMLVAMAIQLFFIPNQIARGVIGHRPHLNRLIPAVRLHLCPGAEYRPLHRRFSHSGRWLRI